MPVYETRVTLAAPREQVFDYLARTEHFAALTAPQAALKLTAGPAVLAQGERLHLELSGLGPTQRMVYEITDFARPDRYTETQVQGPLKAFRQEHLLEEIPGGTALVERVTFEPPGGMLGFVVTADLVRKGLVAGFQYRHAKLAEVFGTV